jgi:hypothetical protein
MAIKDTYSGIEEAFANKGIILNKNVKAEEIVNLAKEEFEMQNKINEIGNKIWRMKNERLKCQQQLAKIAIAKEQFFVKLGLRRVKLIKGAEE